MLINYGAAHVLFGGIEIDQCSGDFGGACSFLGSVVSQTHPDQHDIVFPNPFDSNVVYAANDGGFYFSLDAGANWTAGNSTLTTSQLSSIAAAGGNLLGGLQDAGMGYFSGTRVWHNVPGGDGGSTVVYTPPGVGSDPVWFYTYGQQTPIRSVGDPTKFSNGQTLDVPLSAFLEANDEDNDVPAQCAFFPPLALNDLTHDVHFATVRIYKSTDTDDVRGDSWTTVSPVLATPQGVLFNAVDTDNVITAIAVASDGTIYAGTYVGEVWVSTPQPCADFSCWQRVNGPQLLGGNTLPISSIAIQPGDSNTAYVTLSGFGTTSHVIRTTSRGGLWEPFSAGLVDAPANVIRFDSSGALWLGTDIGIYQFAGTWVRNTTLPFVPVTDITALRNADGTQKIFAATHGRGAWVLTQPTVTMLEGSTSGALTDLAAFGYGFSNASGTTATCTASLLQQSGTVCASGGVDAVGGIIQVDPNGQLQTTRFGVWKDRPVLVLCRNGACIGGASQSQCATDGAGNPDPLSTVQVDCSPAGVGFAQVQGAPTLADPPSSVLVLDPPGDAPTPSGTWNFDIIASRTTATSAGVICRAPVSVAAGTTDQDMTLAATQALNSSAECQSAGLVATPKAHSPTGGEDGVGLVFPPVLTIQAPGAGSQTFLTFSSGPGTAMGVLFELSGLGNPTLRQGAVLKTTVQTVPAGAAGGSVRFVEDSDIGLCRFDVPTAPGMSGAAVAAAIVDAFTHASFPGSKDCLGRSSPGDMRLDGNAIVTSAARGLRIASFDAGVGFASAPAPLDVSNRPPDCSRVMATPGTLWPPNHSMVPIAIAGATDPDGDAVTLTVTQVRQDEDPRGNADATLSAGELLVRSERDGTGDGRVYHIQFTAKDPLGASCSRELTVCVPHDQGQGASCVDEGALYSSGVP
jgi:hypothetical protein